MAEIAFLYNHTVIQDLDTNFFFRNMRLTCGGFLYSPIRRKLFKKSSYFNEKRPLVWPLNLIVSENGCTEMLKNYCFEPQKSVSDTKKLYQGIKYMFKMSLKKIN